MISRYKLKNIAAVGKDQNSRAKHHEQTLVFFVNFKVIIQRYSFSTAWFLFQVDKKPLEKLAFGELKCY